VSAGDGRDLVSAATLDGLCCELAVDREELFECVRSALGVTPALEGEPRAVCELWQVTNGRTLVAGFDTHRFVEQWAGLTGPLLGLGAEAGRALTRLFSLGPYRECLVVVPNVRLEPDARPHSLVLGMVTDDPVALSIDRGFGYGYRKRLGRFGFAEQRRFEVRVEGTPALAGEIVDDGAAALADADRSWLADYWAQPLLGSRGPRDLRRSWLRRGLDEPGARSASVRVNAALEPGFGLRARAVRGRAVSFSGIPVQISLPERLGAG